MNLISKIKNALKPSLTAVSFPDQDDIITTSITPTNILIAKSQKEQGNLNKIISLFDKLLTENDNLAGNIGIREEAAKAALYKFNENTVLSEKQKAYFDEVLGKIMPALIKHTIELKMTGTLFKQIEYTYRDNLFYPKSFLSYKNLDLRVENKILTLYIDDKRKALNELNFITFYNEKPILESLLKYYTFYSFALNNWASFTETFGKPIRIGKYQRGSSKTEILKLKNMILSMGSDLAGVIPDNTLIEFIESKNKSASSDLYKALASFTEERETRRILGSSLTTKSGDNGSYALGKVHDLVRTDILIGDLRDASRYISDFLTMLNKINFNDDNIELILFTPKSIDTSQRINVDEKLNNIIDIPAEYFYKTYGIDEPETGMKLKQQTTDNRQPATEEDKNPKNVSKRHPNVLSSLDCRPKVKDISMSHSPSQEEIKRCFNGRSFASQADSSTIESLEPGTNSTIKAVEETKKELQTLDFGKIQKVQNLHKLEYAFGKDLTDQIMDSYIKEKKSNPTGIAGFQPASSSPTNSTAFDIDWTLKDIEAVNAFRAEAFEVAHVNSQDVLDSIKEDAALALENGESWQTWRDNIELKGFEPENPYHLRTNMNTASNNAYMASQWRNIQDNKEIFPYLEYSAIRDDATRDEHVALDGVVRAVDDEFWNTHYPPNGWNCRCDVFPLTNKQGAYKSLKKAPEIDIPEDFKQNTGKELTIWGKWISRKIANKEDLSYKWSDIQLADWKEIAENATEKAPELLSLKSVDEYRKYFEENIKGTVFDSMDIPIDINQKFFDKQLNSRGSEDRLQKMDWIKPTLSNSDEIWLQVDKGKSYLTYLKAFKNNNKGGFSVVEIDEGQIRTFFEPESSNYFNSNRFGVLVYKR